MVKNPATNAGDIRDMDSTPGLGRSPGGGYGNLLQYSCLENPMDRGAWQATAHRVTQSRTQRSDFIHTHIKRTALSSPGFHTSSWANPLGSVSFSAQFAPHGSLWDIVGVLLCHSDLWEMGMSKSPSSCTSHASHHPPFLLWHNEVT